MSNNSAKVLCQGCGEVFTEFLQDMAEHNETVTCPQCGKVHEPRLARHPEKHDEKR